MVGVGDININTPIIFAIISFAIILVMELSSDLVDALVGVVIFGVVVDNSDNITGYGAIEPTWV